jgi:hypothetical protein
MKNSAACARRSTGWLAGNFVQFPDSGLQRFDVVFGRQVFEVARQVERVCVVRIERQQPRSPEEHGFDGPRRQPFAQDDLVGDAACQ